MRINKLQDMIENILKRNMKENNDIDDITKSMVDEYVGMVGISLKHSIGFEQISESESSRDITTQTRIGAKLTVPDSYQGRRASQSKSQSDVEQHESGDDFSYVLMTDVNSKR